MAMAICFSMIVFRKIGTDVSHWSLSSSPMVVPLLLQKWAFTANADFVRDIVDCAAGNAEDNDIV